MTLKASRAMKKRSKKNQNRYFFLSVIAVLAVAFCVRFYLLELRPMFFDEGTFWNTYINKICHGEKLIHYRDKHGFATWYLSAIPVFLFGTRLLTLRLMVAVAGFLTVGLVFLLRKQIGTTGTLLSAAFMAISPSLVYSSRQFSQYPYILFFSLLSFIVLVALYEKKRPIYLYFFSAIFGLLVTVHEVAVIYLFTIASFVVFVRILKPEVKFFRHKTPRFRTAIFSILIFIFVVVLVMSAFFTNRQSLYSFLSQLSFQFDKAYSITGHNKTPFYYVRTFFPLEKFAFLGMLLSPFLLRKDLFCAFVLYWVFFTLIVFSIIPYKIPWQFTIVLLPMYLLAGITFNELYRKIRGNEVLRTSFSAVMAILFWATLCLSLKLNYVIPLAKVSQNPLNYVGPVDDTRRLISDLKTYNKEGIKILFTGGELWPLPFYLPAAKISYSGEKDNLAAYLNNFDIFIIPAKKTYDSRMFHELGQYELREGYFIKILDKNKKWQEQKRLAQEEFQRQQEQLAQEELFYLEEELQWEDSSF